VVQQAKLTEAETSGATSGNRVAAYLRGDADASTLSQPEKVLERLTMPSASSASVPAATPLSADPVDHGKLAELTKTEAAPPAPSRMAAPAAPANLEKANEKLSSLLNKPK
jgi:hypothetical protein